MKRLCHWVSGVARWCCSPASVQCARFESVTQTICDALSTVTQTICDATAAVTQSICDATETVTNTVCDATATVTQDICDSWGSIPFVGDLVCLFSHAVSTIVCTASHVVSSTICTASHVVSSIVCTASHVVSSTVCTLSHIVSTLVCIAWTVLKAALCVLVGGAALLVCAIARLRIGPGPILRSATQPAPSVRRDAAAARSFVLGSDLRVADLRSPYVEEGQHVEYRLTLGGVAEQAVGAAQPAPLVFDPMELPPFATPAGRGALAASYDRRRLGDWPAPPALDMIAAGGDRYLAKAAGVDRIFVGVVADPYVHPVGGVRLLLPQTYFKLDPELGVDGAKTADLLAHVRIPGDDERHPATERFPLFRLMFSVGALQTFGLVETMDARFPPHVWHEVDLRPPRSGKEPPRGFPTYEHVVYDSGNPLAPELKKHSIAYTRVLDLAVGLSHLHEQHDNRFGGELDNLSDASWRVLGLVDLPVSDEKMYELANGPIRDYGGWVDGTCIYYLLVQLKPDEALDLADPETLKDAFAILWTDEQTGFTERWRALDLRDNDFGSPFKPMVGVLAFSDGPARFYPDAPFDATRFWSPLRAGHVLPTSRLAVTRQIAAVLGRDPVTNRDELYTIHFSWPTMDRTWRWRSLPGSAADTVSRTSLRLREDSTIVLRGARQVGDELLPGCWFQRYLPADGQERPTVQELLDGPANAKPAQSYTHLWSFFADGVFTRADREFSHLGVYEPVSSRVQFYRVTVNAGKDVDERAIEQTVWVDRDHALRLDHERLDWKALADALELHGNPLDAVVARTHPSIYNDPMSFTLRRCPGLGDGGGDWMLMHFDKRDDKLLPFDGVGRALGNVVLSSRDDPLRTIAISVDAHLRNDVRRLHGLDVTKETDAVSPPQVATATVRVVRQPDGSVARVSLEFELARNAIAERAPEYRSFEEWVAVNVWRVKLGALVGADFVTLFDERRADAFAATGETKLAGEWTPSPSDPHFAELASLLSDRGRIRHGTSMWFVGATGLVSCADDLRFEVVDG